ncbi:class I SAM-dependent methyltransferase [Azospirillum brasilense]|uniref:class I SAM-dependent methyltransferase n=1 Tax=Azospirillum brasilense TaxID=192 RepID=UPI000E0AEF70|nr:class I SAM-dependent methyltransferase [Azospirillum brasilense]
MSKSCCRFCGTPLTETFVDLGVSPLANSFLKPEKLQAMEPFYPLHVYVCTGCFLVQLEEFESPEHIFSDYLYFSSFSQGWLDHANAYAAKMVDRLGLDECSLVVEIASNDGYLLQYFKQRGVPVLGVEPAANVAKVAVEKGIPSDVAFFGVETAERLKGEGKSADLMAANNVLAHVPDINDFVAGFKVLLKPTGTITFEFPHLQRLIAENQFDTVYHEHFSYLSLLAVEKVFARHGLAVFDVEQLPTHGGSLRLFVRHAEDTSRPVTAAVEAIRAGEAAAGLRDIATYRSFGRTVETTKREVLRFLIDAHAAGKTVVGYGAPAKGNTLLNYLGVGPEFVAFTVDRSPHKQGLYLPGTRIPIKAPEAILEAKPDYVLILPWNLKDEVMTQMAEIRSWGGKFVVPIPTVQVL